MQSQKEKIVGLLKSDNTLVNMLGMNEKYWVPGSTKAKVNSIIPSGAAKAETVTPFLTIQGGAEVRVGKKYTNETVYLRVYDNKKKFYYSIDKIAERIKSVLDNSELTLSPDRFVTVRYESSLVELEDPGLGLNFREMVFLVSYL